MGHYRLSPMASRSRYPFIFVNSGSGGGEGGGGGSWVFTFRAISLDLDIEVGRVAGVTASFFNKDTNQEYFYLAYCLITDANGEFTITGMEPGPYHITYNMPNSPPHYWGDVNGEDIVVPAENFTHTIYFYPTAQS